ncbi:MAG: DUF4214 domain-containing protein [Clostridiales bacterium]|nr:DUF4214 domain-containing protein [Clostridiales bacterium]
MKRTSAILVTLSTMIPVVLLGGYFVALCPNVNADESTVSVYSFPDTNFREYISSEIDKDSDGKLTESERLSVTSIDVSHKEIHDFTGIAYFPNLEYLDCSMNEWEYWNDYLEYGDDDYLEYYLDRYSHQVLDVSKNTSLKYLNCSGNLLTKLDVSKNASLETLICRNNSLTKLNVANNAELKHLDCSNNRKSSFSGCPDPDKKFNQIANLTLCESADLSYLDISGNPLASVDISAFVSMNKALKHLGISSSSIKSITVSELVSLEYLDVSGTALTTLDVSELASLEYLDVSGTALTTLDVSGLTALKYLDVSGTALTALDISELSVLEKLFCERSKLSTIDISKNHLLKNAVESGLYWYDTLRKTMGYFFEDFEDKDFRLCFSETTELINHVPVDALSFPDEKFRKYVSGKIDTNGDGLLDDDEISSVDSIDVAGLSITDLSGIEYFVNLSKLNCSNNQITELRLSFPRLYVLICHDNPVSQLSIAGCFGLKDFLKEYPLTSDGNKKTSSHSFSGLNYQFSVDSTVKIDSIGGILVNNLNFPDCYFRKYVKIFIDDDRNLELSADEITTLKKLILRYEEADSDSPDPDFPDRIGSLQGIGFFSYLEILACDGTRISSLDVSKNYNLKTLDCSSLNLTSLDVSNNKSLVLLNCSCNKLTSLDLSNNSKLSDLICCNNLLTELDLSNCPNLDYLLCGGNDISELDLQFCPLLENTVIRNTKELRTKTFYSHDSHYMVSCYVYGNAGLDYSLTDYGSDYVSIPENTILKLSTCSVIFDANGGTGVMETMTVEKGTSITLPVNRFAAPVGKVFDKWSVGNPEEKYQVMSTITVSAVWKNAPATPTVTKKPTAVPTGSDTPTPTPSKTTTLTPTKTVTPTKSPTTVPTKAPSGKPTTGPATVTPSVTPISSLTLTPTTKPGNPTPTTKPGQTTPTTPPGQPTSTPVQPTPTSKPGDPTPTPSKEKEPTIADFVERLYTIALNRESEKAGKDFWVNEIVSGNRTGGDCAHFFLIEAPEFLNRGLNDADFVETLYRTFFDRLSEPAGKAFWVGELKSKRMSRQDVIAGFIDSKEWCNVCATYGVRSGAPNAKAEFASNNAIGFATRLYTCCLGREPENGGLKYWSLALTNLEKTGCESATFFFTGDEFAGFGLKNDEYVRRLYTTFMGREPETSEIAYWVGEIAKGTQTKKSVMQFFGSSEEFTNICKTYGIERGEI